jgi:hypothetical protein
MNKVSVTIMGVTKTTKQESETANRCRQTQCSYFLQGGCKDCSCGAKPYHINKKCSACYQCENVPNMLRFKPEEK